MKATGILFLYLAFLLSSCGPKHNQQQHEKVNDSVTLKYQKLDSLSAKIDTLEKLAAQMVASGESYLNNGNTDAEQIFIKAFMEALEEPKAFETNFNKLRKYDIQMLTADDGKLRVFYWLSPYSGSMWHVQNIVQYKDENNAVTALSFNNLYEDKDDEGSPTPFFDHIYTLNTSPQKTYLLTGYGQMSGTEPYTVGHTLVIDQGKFSITKALFKTGKGIKTQLFASAELKENQDKEKLLALLAIIYNAKAKKIGRAHV